MFFGIFLRTFFRVPLVVRFLPYLELLQHCVRNSSLQIRVRAFIFTLLRASVAKLLRQRGHSAEKFVSWKRIAKTFWRFQWFSFVSLWPATETTKLRSLSPSGSCLKDTKRSFSSHSSRAIYRVLSQEFSPSSIVKRFFLLFRLRLVYHPFRQAAHRCWKNVTVHNWTMIFFVRSNRRE